MGVPAPFYPSGSVSSFSTGPVAVLHPPAWATSGNFFTDNSIKVRPGTYSGNYSKKIMGRYVPYKRIGGTKKKNRRKRTRRYKRRA